MAATPTDWNPGAYARFRGLRLRPALDLLAQVPDLPPGDVVDLGCGDGAVAAPLRQRFPDRRLIGVDTSPAMLAQAAGYDAHVQADIADWRPATPPALIFSNAALQWLPDHPRLFPRLAGCLAPGGCLAIQMPRQFDAPSHRLLRDLAVALFPDRFAVDDPVRVASPAAYWSLLAPWGSLSIWETVYLQSLPPASGGHPVRRFTESTAMRPFLARLTPAEADRYLAAYDAALLAPYPLLPEGGALFPFRRLFLLLTRPAAPRP